MDLSDRLLLWYEANGRSLPWREQKDPYKVWLSEIILQQTRVAQGMPYYLKFVERFPTVQDFANASVDEVLLIWQGLGYYSRGRNMHVAANQVINDFGGTFPDNFKELKTLKGVGDYTASAIASIVFDQCEAVVDGNVYRVLSRVFNVNTPIDSTEGKKQFKILANELISKKNPGDYNQAIMDLGAMVCTPKNPTCESCPLNDMCEGRSKGSYLDLPIKAKKTKVTERFIQFYEITDGKHIYIEQRTGKDVWQGLFQYPLNEVKAKVDLELEKVNDITNDSVQSVTKVYETKHILSHQKIWASFFKVEVEQMQDLRGGRKLIKLDEIQNFAVPKLIQNYLEQS